MRIEYLRAAFGRALVLDGKSFQGVFKVRALSHLLHPPFRALFTRPGRVICYCFASLALSVMSAESYAEGFVNPTLSTSAPPMVKYYGYNSNFDTPEAACADMVAHQWDYISTTNLVYDHIGPYPGTVNMFKCYALWPGVPPSVSWFSNVEVVRSCDGTGWVWFTEITCTKNVCPANSKGNSDINPTACTCNTGYAPDAAKTSCVPVATCPIKLTALPTDDACAQSLEAGRGKDINHKCGDITDDMKKEAQCLADKIHALGLSTPYTEPSATIRNTAYQKHLRDVWDKSKEIKKKVRTDEQKQACAADIADVKAHMDWHVFDSPPSKKGNEAPHVEGKAIDIPRDVAWELMGRVSNTTFITFQNCIFCIPIAITTIGDVQDYVNSTTVNPPPCNLKWGGKFTPVDKVHFQLP